MKFTLSQSVFLFGLFSASACAADSYSGNWNGGINDEAGTPHSSLVLSIKQHGQKISGTYCYVTQNGARIDCPDDNTENLHGEVNDESASVSFDSSFGGKNGKAELKLNGDKLLWTLVKAPQKGQFYAPEKYILANKDLQNNSPAAISRTFSTDKFTITVSNSCGKFLTPCENMLYSGIRESDGSSLSLFGKTTTDGQTQKVNGAIFSNGNITYQVLFDIPKLRVIQGDKVLVDQSGQWTQ